MQICGNLTDVNERKSAFLARLIQVDRKSLLETTIRSKVNLRWLTQQCEMAGKWCRQDKMVGMGMENLGGHQWQKTIGFLAGATAPPSSLSDSLWHLWHLSGQTLQRSKP